MQPSRLAKELAEIQDPKVPGTLVRMVGLHATEAAEATLLPFFARATSVSPPWFGELHVVPRELNTVRRLANAKPRAAGVSPPWFRFALATYPPPSGSRGRVRGVSPPWFRFALATAIVFCGLITFRTAHSLTAPRLAYASRSWCTTFVRCTKRHLRCTNARSHERRVSARRGSVTHSQWRPVLRTD
jgi:hypothetical protein